MHVTLGDIRESTFYNWKSNTLVINPADFMDSAFIAGMWMAYVYHTPQKFQTSPLNFEMRGAYVGTMFGYETDGRVRGLKHKQTIGNKEPDHLQEEYLQGLAVDERTAWDKVRDAYPAKRITRGGWTGTYKAYYRKIWEDAQTTKLNEANASATQMPTPTSTPQLKRKRRILVSSEEETAQTTRAAKLVKVSTSG